ncbi:hypothetical protein Slin15195_G110910 [Septoria linicola]|uniref:Uncharacterized protein n=1 Tax=Septoria linicola TaxID=215465 RepID=A0A9Q9AXI1_9PEZI|nr:hypothetical protein Slin15195_G110910 [Septoria linicola]
MPKGLNLKGFGRRKSSGNALDFEQSERDSAAPPAQSTFRVLERPDNKKSISYGREKPASSGKTLNSPLNALRGKSVDNLALGPNRGSGGTTNSGSSGYYESSSASARHSSTSTLPSSLDQDHRAPDDEELFPHPRKSATTSMYQTVTAYNNDPPPPPPPTFSSRAARAFSFGGNKHAKSPSKDVPPLPPPHSSTTFDYYPRNPSPQRERAMTTSSYASTAVPARSELKLSSPDFGSDDFGNMFESLKKEPVPSPPPAVGTFHRTESPPMFPPRTLSRNALTPSPNPLKLSRSDSNSPYSWDDGSSNDELVSNSALSSPSLPAGAMPGPAVGGGITQAFLGKSQTGYARVPERYNSPGLGRESVEDFSAGFTSAEAKEKEPAYMNRQAQVDDEDRWTRKVELRDAPQGGSLSSSASNSKLSTSTNATARQQPLQAGPSRNGAVSPNSSMGDALESNTTTPRAAKKLNALNEDSMFDVSPAGPASRAVRPGVHHRSESGTGKTMTKAQYQAMVKRGESSGEQSEEEDLSDEDYDEEDEIERAKKLATQRRKQEANMSVYRQQMKKVTGGGPTDLPSSGASTRPGMDRGSTAPSSMGLHFGGIGGQIPDASIRGRPDEDEDEDVPLGILQAHNFPNSGRPPTRLGENDLQQRRTSVAGSIANGGAGQGNLPPFARRLPQDPYFGAGLVNPSTRESLALNNSAGSVVGMPPSAPQLMVPGHPGGLVGVIAGEEKARAARRGSPNAAALMGGGSGSKPLPSNMMPQPNMQRAMSMGNVMPPSVYSPSGMQPMPPMPQMNPMMMGMQGMMPQMPQMPQDANQQQMQQFMAMQMQLMQNMINMQQAQMGGQMTPLAQTPQQQQQAGDYLGVNFNQASRPMSMASQQGYAPQNQGRAPRPNSAMPMTGNGYAPSVNNVNAGHNGPGAGYTPSIAPSERSNIGMPSRYRPVTQNGETSRSQSMTSSLTLQAFANQQTSPNLPGTPYGAKTVQAPKSTIRVVDKPRGAPKVASGPADEDEDDGWADMKKKREDKKKSKWSFRKDKSANNESALSELYQSMD